ADLGGPVVRRAHEGAQALVIGHAEHTDDRPGVPEAHGLGTRRFLRHAVHADELLVAKEQSLHCRSLSVFGMPAAVQRAPKNTARRRFGAAAAAAAAAACAEEVRVPAWASAMIIEMTRSVIAASPKEFSLLGVRASTQRAK